MPKEKMRTIEYNDKRTGIKLDPATWQAVDWLAKQKGVKWSALARDWLTIGTNGTEADTNLTRIIRSSAMSELLNETIFSECQEKYSDTRAFT